jgi:hypothetical protein
VKRQQSKSKFVRVFSTMDIWFICISFLKSSLELYFLFSFVRFTGTIVGIGASDPAGWADSKWRSLKVFFPIFGSVV